MVTINKITSNRVIYLLSRPIRYILRVVSYAFSGTLKTWGQPVPQRRQTWTYIHASRGMRSHDPSVRAKYYVTSMFAETKLTTFNMLISDFEVLWFRKAQLTT